MAAPVLLFVPLDDRPVTMDMVVDLARAGGVDVRTPHRTLLGDRDRPGEPDAIWEWLARDVAQSQPAALIASVEMLCFGGLVASRKSAAAFEEIVPRLRRVAGLAAKIPTYLSAVIPRTPQTSTDEDARDSLAGPHRARHLRLNRELIEMVARGGLRFALIGQDDAWPGSPSEADRAALQEHADSLDASNMLLTSGADELNVRLLARWLNDFTGSSPAVQIVYTYPEGIGQVPLYEATPLSQTVGEHVRSTGCQVIPSPLWGEGEGEGGGDILLWVHNFTGQQCEAVDQGDDRGVLDAVGPIMRTVRSAVLEERIVALADVRFANGGDRTLAEHLLQEPRFTGIVAYAGWNTSSNTLGSALAQAVVAYHLRANTLPGSDRRYRTELFRRLLDDLGYQSVVRPQLRLRAEQKGASASDLGEYKTEAEHIALDRIREDALPSLQRAFAHHPVIIQQVTCPWRRLFEVRIELDVVLAGRRRPAIAVVDYDPRWPRVYEDARTVITQALGALLHGIEHVGSTAVPGLAAKATVDIMLGVNVGDLDRVIEPLTAIGYEYIPDWEISMPFRRYFRRTAPDGTRTHHLHAVAPGGEFWTRHLLFRDYLRAHPDKASEYGDLKRQVAREHQDSIEYTFAKTEFIRSVEALAGFSSRRSVRLRPGTT